MLALTRTLVRNMYALVRVDFGATDADAASEEIALDPSPSMDVRRMVAGDDGRRLVLLGAEIPNVVVLDGVTGEVRRRGVWDGLADGHALLDAAPAETSAGEQLMLLSTSTSGTEQVVGVMVLDAEGGVTMASLQVPQGVGRLVLGRTASR